MKTFKVAYYGKGTKKLLLAYIKIEGVEYKFMVDTGATTNIIHHKRVKPFRLISKKSTLKGFMGNKETLTAKKIISDEGFIIDKPLVTDLSFLRQHIKGLKGVIGLNFFIRNKVEILFK